MLLKGKTALITGAGSGIGKAIALKMTEEGAEVILAGRKEVSLQNVQEQIVQKGGRAGYFLCDVRKPDEITEITEKIMKQYGKIDILVNNAGISKEMPFLDMPVEVFDEICETNLRSVMLMMKAVLPYMKEQKSGNVVNIGSGAAIRG